MSAQVSFSYFSYCHLCLLVVLTLFHLCLSKQNSDQVLCIDSERQALLRFKHGLTDEAHRLASWVAEDKDCCRWVGIACDNSSGHVLRIHLPGLQGHCLDDYPDYYSIKEASKNRLRGYISPSLLGLKQLMHLDLSCNDFEGIQIPEFIGFLQNLRYLNLSVSNFGGVIPPQLGNLSKLHVLSLGKFQNDYLSYELTTMVNMEWLSSLRLLHHLDMSGVYLGIETNWLQVINNLHSLLQLHLSNCYLSDAHPYVRQLNLTSLSLLDLSFNSFHTVVPHWLFSITSLVSLDIRWSFHEIISDSVHSFHNLTSLEFLHAGGNDFMNSSLVLEELSSSSLIMLDISYCGVSSSVLNSLYNLTNLLSLDMSSNQLTKRIPKLLGNLCNLREIDLSRNSFGTISLEYLLESFLDCKLPALESLSLSKNYIGDIIPHSIWRLSFLRKLDLKYNRLYDSLPDSLGQLSKLAYLDFSYNLLTGVVTETHFVNLVSLKHLYGTGNNLTLRLQDANWLPPFQLQRLDLNSWVLGPNFPPWLQSQKDLMYLDISNTKILSPMPDSFVSSFHNLSYLNISHNQIQGKLTLLGIPRTLEAIDLNFNELSGSLHDFLCLNDVKDTRQLVLGNNRLSGVIPDCWERWTSLAFLNLENNNLSGEIPRTLGFIPSLIILNMRGNKISGRLPTSLENLIGLMILQLGRNELVGSIPAFFGTKLTSLRILNLNSNNFDENIPHELCYLIHILALDLSHNNLSGNIPRCFNNYSFLSGLETNSMDQFYFSVGSYLHIASDSLVMKGREDTYSTILGLVKLLDLSSNNLVGHIPSELTSLQQLRSLNLSRNHLIGRIPEKIGDMKALESFDLSVNKLSGELPMSLSRLTFLSSFNVSYNNFTGRVPDSTQLQSMNESSFFGNKLCGAPLTNGCVKVEVPPNTIRDKKEHHGEDLGLIISIVIGFVCGFWIIMAPLIVSRSWRSAYFHLLSKFRYTAYDVCISLIS